MPSPVATTSQHTSPTAISASKSDFISQMWPHAKAAADELGVDPHALLAQAALETGWGKSVPCNSSGECSFNLFGIKAGNSWSGASVNVPTLEFEEGVAVRKVERFRSYESPADSFRDYAKLIGNNARYENAVGTGDNVVAFAQGLQQGGYATDPNYARKLVAVAHELRGLTAKAGV
jgi:peptidoglycan hydrolase FlgJ